MNPYFQQMISQLAVAKKALKKGGIIESRGISKFNRAKSAYRVRKTLKQHIKNSILIIIGIFSASFGLKSFVLPNNFIDGGATGISLLISELSSVSLSITIIIVNIPFIIIGYQQMGSNFTFRTILAILGLALCIALVPYPIVTDDKLLIAVFGGIFLGAGIGFAMRGGAVLDGTEVLAIYLNRKSTMSVGDIILVFNIIIFSMAAWQLGINTALYSMLTYFAASKTVDFLIEGIEEYTGVTIISPKSYEIGQMIALKLGRGITIYSGKGGYGKKGYAVDKNMSIIFTVITRLEISKLKSEIELIDPNAFVVMHSIKDTRGGMIKKRAISR